MDRVPKSLGRPASGEPTAGQLTQAASAHYGAGRLEIAAALLARVEALDPHDVQARYVLAVIDLRRGRFAEARRRLKAVLRRQGDHFAARQNLGVAEQALGEWEAAAHAYGEALALRPRAAEPGFALAIALAVLGRAEAAIDLYRELATAPDLRARALTRLAVLRAEAITDEELESLRRLEAGSTGELRTALLFAQGGVLEARGQDDEAWEAFTAGNALKRQILSAGPPEAWPQTAARENALSIARVRGIFTPDFLAENAGEGERSTRPIFIVGMPRSGSSLIEQILASHPQVQGMGESGALWGAMEGRFPYPPQAPRTGGHFGRLAQTYLAAQRARGWRSRARLVDKTLDNHLHVGMIHLMFPGAVILHAQRDPVDTGLACWRQLFARGAETLYDLAEIGAEIRRYRAMMAHWDAALPGRVTPVTYEDLVADPEGRIHWLVTQACGLPWHEACLRFHETRRVVGTASAEQVRRPIFATSVGRRRRYTGRLEALEAALAR